MMEYSKIGLEFMIISIKDERLNMKWLGTIISKQNVENFIIDALSGGIDPCGEYGEYHSLVISLKDLNNRLEYDLINIGEESKVLHVILQKPIKSKKNQA